MLSKVSTKSSTSSLFPVTASGLRHFWAIYKNLLLKLMSRSFSNKLILAFSLHNFLKWSILPYSSVVSSGYFVLSLSRNWFQDPASYSSKLVHWSCISASTYPVIQSNFFWSSVISAVWNNCSIILRKFLSVLDCPSYLGVLRLRGKGIFNLAVIFCIGYWVVTKLLNGSVNVQDGGNEVSLSERACVTSDMSSSSDSLEIMYTLERLDLSGIIGPICSAEVSKKGFSSTSEGDPRLGVGHSDSSNISELTCHLLATNLAFFCNICSRLSTRCTHLAHCTVEVWWLLVLVAGWFSTLERFKELGIF